MGKGALAAEVAPDSSTLHKERLKAMENDSRNSRNSRWDQHVTQLQSHTPSATAKQRGCLSFGGCSKARQNSALGWTGSPWASDANQPKTPKREQAKEIQPQKIHRPERIKHEGKKTDPQTVQGETQVKEVGTLGCHRTRSRVRKHPLEAYRLLLSSSSVPDSLPTRASTWAALF